MCVRNVNIKHLKHANQLIPTSLVVLLEGPVQPWCACVVLYVRTTCARMHQVAAEQRAADAASAAVDQHAAADAVVREEIATLTSAIQVAMTMPAPLCALMTEKLTASLSAALLRQSDLAAHVPIEAHRVWA